MSDFRNLHPIFHDCTLQPWDERRHASFDLSRVWVGNERYIYATDGAILVRAPTRRQATPGDWLSDRADFVEIWERAAPRGLRIALPPVGGRELPVILCPKCENGAKRNKTECSKCEGRGRIVRSYEPIKLPSTIRHLADYYIWLLKAHGIRSVRRTSDCNIFAFEIPKWRIEGRLMRWLKGGRSWKCI